MPMVPSLTPLPLVSRHLLALLPIPPLAALCNMRIPTRGYETRYLRALQKVNFRRRITVRTADTSEVAWRCKCICLVNTRMTY